MPRETTTTADGEVTEVTIRPRKITVGFTRKLRPANYSYDYETVEGSAHVEADVDENANSADVDASVKEAWTLAKSSVYEQLGVAYEVDASSQVARELLETKAGASKVASKPKKQTAKKSTSAPKSQGDLWNDLLENPQNWWDNREDKRNPRAPDFKKAGTNEGLWITDQDGNENVDVSQLEGLVFKG